jgi:glutathione synthase/RimK-type ligase-like ATP-grasp enzyme
VLLDSRQLLATEIDLLVDGAVRGSVHTPGGSVSLGEVTGAYLRPGDFSQCPELASADPGSAIWQKAAYTFEQLFAWAELTAARVINRPRAMAANHSKPYQLTQIQAHGFHVPDTLLTTDASAVVDFWNRHGRVIYKSASGVRSIVAQLRPEHRERLTDVVWCPTQFQEYVEGRDYRAHVVGDEIFSCEINSVADDYRYAALQGRQTSIYACELPDDVGHRCIQMVSALGLAFGGVDLRRTPDHQWYCFEVNPSPGFTYFEAQTHQPIADRVAKMLSKPELPVRTPSPNPAYCALF